MAIANQGRGGGPPANDLQSQLNDMPDDSASDNSSTLQTLGAPMPPMGPAQRPLGGIPQDRGLTPNLVARTAGLPEMRANSDDETEVSMQDVPLLGQDQQQVAGMSLQLQVSVWL